MNNTENNRLNSHDWHSAHLTDIDWQQKEAIKAKNYKQNNASKIYNIENQEIKSLSILSEISHKANVQNVFALSYTG